MTLKKQHLVLLLIVAVLLGFAGAFLGMNLAQPDRDSAEETSTTATDENASEPPANMQKVAETYNLIKSNYLEDVEDKQLIEGAIKGMVSSLDDPYSSYMDVESMEQFNQSIESSFQGIGAEVSMVNDKVTIVSPIKDSPAEEAGLRPNDQILSVDGESVAGLNLNEAVEKIRGEKGTEVVLEVQRSGVSEPFDVTIVRDDIPVETVYSETKTIDGKKTGVIEIASFAENTGQHFTEQLKSLEEENIEGLVIDVRGNPGGVLSAVEEVLKNFIPNDKPYVQIENPNGETDKSYSELEEKKPYPISVLIDEGSASASEILAVAMKETGYDVVGKNSFGKGTVQRAVPVGEDGSRVKLTVFKWLSPDGTWIHEEGVKPTVEVEQPEHYYTNPVQVDETITFDETGDNVKNIQVMLNGLGYEPGRTDGYFGEATVTAVENFQEEHDLEVTGEVDEETAGLIETQVVDRVRNGQDDRQMEEALNSLYE